MRDRRPDPRATAKALPLPEDVAANELDPDVRRDLLGLSREVADRVARHLVVAGRLLEEDPEKAFLHGRAAQALAGRIAVVREAAGITAYRAGHFTEALADLRAARRMSGSDEHLPLLADCERAAGRPERALELARDPAVSRLDPEARVEMRIVASGARRDLGQVEAAVVELAREVESDAVDAWSARLWYAYAAALLDAGRATEARQWFLAAASVDDDGGTDAEERVRLLDAAAL